MENNGRNNSIFRGSDNPAFRQEILAENVIDIPNGEVMTVNGAINKTAICLLLVVMAGAFVWNLALKGYMDMVQSLTFVSAIVAMIMGFVIIFKRQSQAIQFLVPLYALFEGAFLGGVSFMFETYFPGVVLTAVKATVLCVAVMLFLFKTGIIKVTDKLRAGIIMCTATIAGIYLIDILLSFFGIRVPFLYSTSPVGIGVSVSVVIIAAFNLLLDFDFIYQASQRFMPKFMEWYGAFGLMVTIVWLYIELLKLLAKLQRRD